jgi:amino acid adenylation domain-containing protein
MTLENLVDLARFRAADDPQRIAYVFLGAGEAKASFSHAELDRRARSIGAHLQQRGLAGKRALLLFPPGLEYLAGFFGCLYAGVVAVPALPPSPRRPPARLLALMADARPAVALGTASALAAVNDSAALSAAAPRPTWLDTEQLSDAAADWRPPSLTPETLAFLQYTSGSTGTPRGVMLSHRNLLVNLAQIQAAFGTDPSTDLVSWLPPYHDMGLIGCVLQPLFAGFRASLMSPAVFLQRPASWLEAISSSKATLSGGPNFAYQMCVQRVSAEQRHGLDLSCWKVAFNGSEPVRAETLQAFAEAFGPCGFDRRAFFPCYGLAEATLFVAGSARGRGPTTRTFLAEGLAHNRAILSTAAAQTRSLVAAGHAPADLEIAIVDPGSGVGCPPGEVGEIWVAGPTVAGGYWQKSAVNREQFRARRVDRPGPAYLRTGDLGCFVEGELFVTGRLKDLIILAGQNHYPQDIEQVAGAAHPDLRSGAGAAFSIEQEGAERLVVVHELDRRAQAPAEDVARAVWTAVRETLGLPVFVVALIRPGSLPRTSSGKVQRQACKTAYLGADLALVSSTVFSDGADGLAIDEPPAAAPATGGEAELAKIWQEVLGVAEVKPDDDFFALGGQSLLAARVVARTRALMHRELPLAALFETPSLAALARRLQEARAADGAAAIPRLADAQARPSSFAQERLWFVQQLEPDASAYTIPGLIRLSGDLDLHRLEDAFNAVVARHEVLRTRFAVQDGRPVQLVLPTLQIPLRRIDLRGSGDFSAEAAAARALEELRLPFDLASGPLVRLSAIRYGERDHLVGLAMHHIVSDGWSVGVLAREIGTIYNALVVGETPALPPLPLQYGDFANWQRRALTPQLREAQLSYWATQLAGELPRLDLPSDWTRPAVQSFTGGYAARRLSAELSAAVNGLCRQESCTLFVTLLAAFEIMLHRQTGERDIVVGAPMVNRSHLELEGLIGNFLDLLPLRGRVSPEMPCRQLMAATREVVLGAFAHRQVPFEEIVRKLQPDRDPGRSPLFQVMFNLINVEVGGLGLAGVDEEILDVAGAQGSMFDLTLYATERRGRIKLEMVFNADLFESARVDDWLAQLELFLTQMVADPGRPIGRLSALTPKARSILVDPTTPMQAGQEGSIAAAISAQASRRPGAVALRDQAEVWTYADLEDASSRLAQALRAHGLATGQVVAVFADRSASLACALLGILKAGGAFLILDPAHPAQRLARCMEIAAPAFWIHLLRAGRPAPELEQRLEQRGLPRLSLGGLAAVREDPLLARQPAHPPEVGFDPDALAYVAFTSGSTGGPRAIAGTHRPLSHFFRWQAERFGLGEHDRFGVLSGLAHDPLLRDVFTPLWIGAQAHFPDSAQLATPGYLAGWAAERDLTALHLVPSLAGLLTAAPAALPTLRHVFFGGEPLTRGDVARLWRVAPSARVVNFYGTTETPQAVGYHPVAAEGVGPDGPETLPIGRGVEGAQLLVLREGERAGLGELGELHVRSPHLARGYLGDPALTGERFLSNPFSGQRSDRLYRTGDLARYRPDGLVELCGRADRQVKIRGVRIEPAEVTASLERLPGVAAAAVLALGEPGGDRRLAAYVVPAPLAKIEASQLRAAVAGTLPPAMVPSMIYLVEALPLTPHGKLDEQALRQLAISQPAPALPDEQTSAATDDERRLAAIWADVLDHEGELGREASFFQMGGHSLLGTRLIARVREQMGVELRLRDLFEAPTLTAMAAAVQHARRAQVGLAEPLPGMPENRDERHQPFPLTDVQQAYWIGRGGAYELGNVGSHGYAELEVQDLDVGRLERALQALVERHEVLRLVVLPDGTQRILPEVPELGIPVGDLRSSNERERAAALAAIRERMSHQVLDAGRCPLFEIRATRLSERCTRLHLSFDLLISDAWSFRLLAAELAHLYRAPEASLPPLTASFRDYVMHLPGIEATELHRRAQAYWEARLSTLPDAPALPLVKSAAEVTRPRFERRSGRLEPQAWQALKARAARVEVTPSGLLLAAFAEVLARWSKAPRFCLNLTMFDRLPVHPQINQVVGDFTSVTLLEVDGAAAPTFERRARRIQRQLFEDLDHRAYSGVKVLRRLARLRGGPPRALMPVVFTSTLGLGEASGQRRWSELGELVYNISQTPQVWLDHQAHEVGGALAFNWDAVEELFPPRMLDDMFAAYCALIERLASQEDVWQEAAPSRLPPDQLARRERANATVWRHPAGLLHSRFEERARQQPHALAVHAPDRQLNYGELEARANALGWTLRQMGARANRLVAVVMEKGWEQVVAVLGVLKSGAAYLPLEPGLPQERLWHLLASSRVELVVTQPELDTALSWPPDVRRALVTDAFDVAQGQHTPDPSQTPDDLAYVIYTSGSTGLPKGVMIDHRGAANTVDDINDRFGVGPADKVLALSSLSFDLSVYDIFGLLAAGGTVVMRDPAGARDPLHWADLVRGLGITVWNTVPVSMGLFAEAVGEGGASSLRLVLLSGDWIPLRLPARVRQLAPAARVVSLGGATEASIWSVAHEIGDVSPDWKSIPYGRALRNQSLHVLDQALEPTPDLVPGKLYIGGIGVARGYFGDEARTRASFIVHPRTGETLYATGDLGRWLPDGNIEFLGREDLQVKIRGHRIELGEIEAALARHPALEAAVVAVAGDPRADRHLILYAVAKDRPTPGARPDLRSYLREKLPEYMVPAQVVWLPALPVTANGKIDRGRLPALAAAPACVTAEHHPPRDDLERQLAGIWAEVLGRADLGTGDNFFDLGGDSLVAARLALRVRAELGIDLPLRWLFESPTVAGLRERLTRQPESAAAEELPPLRPAPAERHEPFPLTDVQEAYWMGRSAAFELGRTATHVYLELEYPALDLPRVERAWRRLVERHEMLRMIVRRDGRQQILATVPDYQIEVLDLRSGSSEQEVERALEALRLRMAHQVHPADRWPLFEIRATQLGNDRTRLHLSFDLLVADAWSLRLVAVELVRLYEAPDSALPALSASFRDYVLHQPRIEETDLYRRAQAYWEERLPTLPSAPNLPLARSPTEVKEPRFRRRSQQLDAARWEALKARGASAGLTPSGLLLAVFSEVLSRWTQEPKFCLNLPLFNRLPVHPQINDVVGDFTTVTLLEVDTASAPTFEERARRLQERLFRDLDHRAYSGVKVLRKLGQRRGGPPRALMPVVFTSTLGLPARRQSSLLDQERVLFGISQTPQVWLDHQVFEAAGALVFNWDAVDELFPAGMLDDMLDAHCTLLAGLAAEEAVWHAEAPVMLPEGQRRRRDQANATTWNVPQKLLHAAFEEQARTRPQAVAVQAADRALSYGELEERANGLARTLRAQGAVPNRLVAVVMEKGWEQAVGVLGVLKSGAAYLPLDPGLPRERLWHLLQNAEVEQLVTQPSVETRLGWPAGIRRHVVAGDYDRSAGQPLPPAQRPEDLAYVLYTSGSTGLPKGAMIPHRGASNTVADINDRFGVGPADRALALSSLSFDLSVYDLFGMLSAGGTLVMLGPATLKDTQHWAHLVRSHGVTVWNTVPTLMGLLTDVAVPEDLSSLRLVLLSGDWIPVKLPDRVRALAPGAKVVSLGGPTETSIWSVGYEVERVSPEWKSIPYGRPLRNQTLHVLDAALEPAPDHVPGQLYIGGLGLGSGYFRDPDLTRAAFIVHPRTGERLYRSGDLCRWLPDGNIEILGREDFQVKIRGNRVELGEIEATLLQHPELDAAVVVAAGDPRGERRLVLYAVARRPSLEGPGPDLRAYLRERLPEYMVPSQVVWLDRLPVTANGKVDRGGLRAPPPPAGQTSAVGGQAPRDDLEKRLLAIWADILGRNDIGVRDNFFDLGGSSVQLMQVLARLRDLDPERVSAIDLFESPTILAMGQLLRRGGGKPLEQDRSAVVGQGKQRLRQRLQQNRKDGAKG